MSEDANSASGALRRQKLHSGVSERRLLEAALRSREQEIRDEILQITSSAERADYLDEVCQDDPQLRDRMFAWLADQEETAAEPLEESSSPVETHARLIHGRYQLLRKIGEGGFGTVYLAEQLAPIQRRVALKILKLGMDTRQVVARFELERQTLALMDHPHIAKVFDAGATETGRPYFVMELVKGVPITRFCDHRQLSLQRRLELFAKVCQAVQHAHQKGIIHRDLKPSNILVAVAEGTPNPKVIDFGIAKATQQELTSQTVLTQEHHLLGTPAYISPEQAALAGADIDTRSDIYSLGVLLYELLTGSTPFDTKELTAAGLDEMRRIIQEREPLRPSSKCSRIGAGKLRGDSTESRIENSSFKIDRDLDWIVLKCLHKDRALRYATANGLAADVQRYLAHETVVARPPNAFYRISKLVRRNRVVTGLGLVLFLALVSAMVAGAFMGLKIAKAKRETDEANRRLSQAVRILESEKMEQLSAEGRRTRLLVWLASHMRQNPADPVAASRALSMLSLCNFALPIAHPLMHQGPVNSAQFSPDGAQILTAADDRTVRFWDSTTGRPLGGITNVADGPTACYAAGGTRVMVVTRDDTARVYEASSRAFLFEVSGLRRGICHALRTSNGDWLYAAHQTNTVSRWNLQSGQRAPALLPVSSSIRLMAASPLGDCVAVACEDGAVHLLNASTGHLLQPVRQFNSPASNLLFTPDGGRLFIPLRDGRLVAIWDFRSSNTVSEFVPPTPIQMKVMKFTPDGRRLVTSSWAAPLRIWDAQTLQLLNEPIESDLQGWSEYTISGDGSRVAGMAQNGTARIWDVETGQLVIEAFEHRGWIRSLMFNSNDTQVVTASQDGTARLWDVRMRQPPAVLLPLSAGGGEASFNHAGTRLIISVDLNAVQICDARTGKPVGPPLQHPLTSKRVHIRRAAFSSDDSKILTAGEEGVVCVWDAASHQLEHELPVQHSVVGARFSPDGRFIVVGDRQGYATIWSTESGSQVAATAKYSDEVIALDFRPQGNAFVAASADGTARCWALPHGQPVSPTLQHRGIVWSAVYSPDGTRIVTASADRTAQIWDAQTGQPLLDPLQHEKDVLSARFSPDGKWILTTSEERTARVWSALTAEPLSPVLRHASKVWMGAFSSDSRWVATGSDDLTVRLWDPQSGLPMSEPLPHPGFLGRLAFSRDGQRLLTFGGQPKLWDVLIAPTPVPTWFCDLVETVAGTRLGPNGEVQMVSSEAIDALRKRFAPGTENGFYARWTKWFLIDRCRQDPISHVRTL